MGSEQNNSVTTQYNKDVTLHPGRKQIYPLGSDVTNVPRTLFSSQSCHNYVSTRGIPFNVLSHLSFPIPDSLFYFLER